MGDLKHKQQQVRRQAILKLGNIGDAAPEVAPALTQALKDREPLIRKEAIYAIYKLRNVPRDTLEAVEQLSRSDRDASVRELATRATEKLKARE